MERRLQKARRVLGAGARASTLSLALVAVICLPGSDGSVALRPLTAASTVPGECPSLRDPDSMPVQSVRGARLPGAAIGALLCVYGLSFDLDGRQQLTETYAIGDTANGVLDYLNGVMARSHGQATCLLVQRTEYTVVFEYRQGYLIVPISCGLEDRGGAPRGTDARKVVAFWGVDFH